MVTHASRVAGDSSSHNVPRRAASDTVNDSTRSLVNEHGGTSSMTSMFRRVSSAAVNLQNKPLRPAVDSYIPYNVDEMPWWHIVLRFIGPGAMVAVGYIDPGNWATDLEGGSRFYYDLLFAILLANAFAIVLQSLAVKIGVVTGNDLAQCCRLYLPPTLNHFLYVTAEAAIIATDLAEVVGSAIAFHLLFGISLPVGVALTGLDVLLILFGFTSQHLRLFEMFLMLLFGIVATCFISLVSSTGPIWTHVINGFIPRMALLTKREELLLLIGIIGATVMPHNLYLQSNLVLYRYNPEASHDQVIQLAEAAAQDGPWKFFTRKRSLRDIFNNTSHTSSTVSPYTPARRQSTEEDTSAVQPNNGLQTEQYPVPLRDELDDELNDEERLAKLPAFEIAKEYPIRPKIHRRLIRNNLRYSYIDTAVSLLLAVFINCAILIVAASAFHTRGFDTIASIEDAYKLLRKLIGSGAATLFAVALLCSGQSSTIIGTVTGQIVMNGFLSERGVVQRFLLKRPWLRRLATRSLAIIPAIVVSLTMGMEGVDKLLIASQVVLSFQLPFAILPLVLFTSRSRYMTVKFAEEENEEAAGNTEFHVGTGSETLDSNESDQDSSVEPLTSSGRAVVAHDYANSWSHIAILISVAIVVISLNTVLVVRMFV